MANLEPSPKKCDKCQNEFIAEWGKSHGFWHTKNTCFSCETKQAKEESKDDEEPKGDEP